MNNNIFEKLTQRIPQQFYGGTSSFKIRGTLVEKNGDTIRLNIGGDKVIEALMKHSVKGEIGETIIIDKKNILQSKLYKEKNQSLQVEASSSNEEDDILKKWNLPVNEDTKGAMKSLEKFGIQISKENIQTFIAAKEGLGKIIEGLDYDTAIKLMEKDIDIEEDSLQKVADMLEKIKGEKEGFSFLKLFTRKKAMSLEEAEKTASQLYGNKMGKDITDIIKALHKAGVEVTRNNVEKVNNIFNKLEDLQEIEENTIIDSIKNKIETSVDNLYKFKNAIVKNVIAAEEKISQLATRAYEAMGYQPDVVTEKDLQRMEGNIKELLTASDIEATEENVKLAKELIRSGLDVSRENIEKINDIKEALRQLHAQLDYEKTAALMKSGVQIDKESVTDLLRMVEEIVAQKSEGDNFDGIGMKEEFLETEKINSILDTVKDLQLIDEKQLLQLIRKGADFKLGNLQLLTIKGSGKEEVELQLRGVDNTTKTLYHNHIRAIQSLSQLKTLDMDTIAYHINNKLPNSINGLLHSQLTMGGRRLEAPQKTVIKEYVIRNAEVLGVRGSSTDVEAAKALMKNNIALHKGSFMQLYKMNSHIENIKNNLSSHTIRQLTAGTMSMEDMDIETLSALSKGKTSKSFDFLQNLGNIGQQKETILTMLMKNAIPMNLKEIHNLELFLNNKQQIAMETDKILRLLEKSNDKELKDLETKVKRFLGEVTEAMRSGKVDAEKTYQQLGKWMKEVEAKVHLFGEAEREAFQKSNDNLKDSISLQNQLNKEDTVLQLPVMMENQLKNLQIYIMNKKKSNKKIDPNNMSILLNFDTNHMGNVNIYTGVNHKKVVMKIGIKNQSDKNFFEVNKKHIEELLTGLGYELKEMTFRVEEEQNLLTMAEEIVEDNKPIRSFLDIKI